MHQGKLRHTGDQITAANINNLPQRFDYARTEHDDGNNNNESASLEGQSAQPTESTIAAPSEQQSQSGGDGYGGGGNGANAHAHDPSTPSPVPLEADALAPSYMRYGIGDTVIMGRPDYVRMQTERERAQPSVGEPSPREPGLREPSLREPNPRLTALAPTPRAENTPLPLSTATATTASTTTAKPIPLPKPGGNTSPISAATTSPPALTTTFPPVTGAAITGEAVEPPAPSNRTPNHTSGLTTAPEQSPHYANALAYGREHGYNDDEVMKLAVLMQNNGDQNKGHEWLTLKPDVLRTAVNAVVRNAADNSFDTSGVFGGRVGYPRTINNRLPADATTAAYMAGENVPQDAPDGATAPPEGWALVQQTVVSPGSTGDGASESTTITLRYHVPLNELNQTDENAYLPLAVAGYMQVPRGYESELSVGADGGVNDLSALAFDPEYGLVTRIDNYRPYHADGNDWDRFMEIVTIGTIAIGTMAVLGPVFAPAVGASTTTVVAAGAAQAVVGSAITTMLQGGEVTFRGLLQSAFTGGLFAGLSTLEGYQGLQNAGLDRAGNVTNYALRAVSITGQATLRGAIQEIIGGRFRDGFTQGMVQGLSNELTRFLNAEITAGLTNEQITPGQASALRELTRFTGSALRAAANPKDPMYAFAQDYLGQLLGPGGTTVPEVRGTAFDDDGNVMPGVVDTTKPLEQQQQQLRARLEAQGLSPTDVNRIAQNYFAPQFMARDRFAGGVSTPVFDNNGNLNFGVVDNRQTEAQQRQEIAARLIAQGVAPSEALRLANQVTLITTTPQEIRQNRIEALTRTYTQQGVTTERARQIAIGDVDGFGSESYLDSTIDYSATNREALARMLGVSPDTIIDVASRPNEVTRIINEARRVRNILDDDAVQRFGNDPAALSAAFRQNDITATQYRALLIDVTFATPERMANAQTLVNRVLGFVQAGGGAALMAAGYGASTTGIGLPLGIAGIGLGADQVAAGLNTMIDGVPVKTLLEQGLIASGMSEGQAALAAGLLSISPVVLERSLANPAVRAYLVERLGPMFGDLPPEKLIGLQRVFSENFVPRNSGSITVGDAAEEVVAQELAKLGYKDVVAIKSNNGQGIDIVARASDGSIMIFEVKGTQTNTLRPLPSYQSNFDDFINRVLGAASESSNGYGAEARANAAAIIRARLDPNTVTHAVRVNVTFGPSEVTTSKPNISFVPWDWKK